MSVPRIRVRDVRTGRDSNPFLQDEQDQAIWFGILSILQILKSCPKTTSL